MTIFLIGMPGSGKTSIGKQLAEKLQLPFFDTDEIISSLESKSIPEIFEASGESYFRTLESDLMNHWKLHHAVVATGGGLPAHGDLMEVLNNLGTTIWLKTPMKKLEERLTNVDLGDRPLFQNSTDISKTIKTMLQARKPFYNQAKIRINADESEAIIVNRILRKLYS